MGTSVSAKLEPSFDYKRKEFLTTDKLYQAVADAINRELEDIDNVDIQFEPSGQKKQIRKDKKNAKELRFRSRGNIYKMTPSAVASVVMLLSGMG